MAQKKASTQKTKITKDDKAIAKVGTKLSEQMQTNLKYAVVEDLFNNYSVNTGRIYRINFLRGLFFGAGSVIGGTAGIAFLVWFLSFFVDWPVLGEAVERFLQALSRAP